MTTIAIVLSGHQYAPVVVVLESVLTCPNCGTEADEIMPVDACRHVYTCVGCAEVLTPLAGDCCVFCSYATVACPPVQAAANNDSGDAANRC